MIYFLFLDVSPTFVTSGLDISLILVAIVQDKIVPSDEHVFYSSVFVTVVVCLYW